MFLQVGFYFLEDGIESFHISMLLDSNNSNIYMPIFSTEKFMLSISVLQCKLAGIIYSTLHLDDPVIVFQTISIRTLTVK